MHLSQFQVIRSHIAIAVMSAFLSAGLAAQVKAKDSRAPEVPDEIKVPQGNKVHFHCHAEGVQIYKWDGASWGSAVPRATLFDDDGDIVATHFGGPTWRSNSGSEVVGSLVPPPLRVTVDPTAIPWLRLTAAPELTHGPGIFAKTTFIHRVNTVGGKAPAINGTVIGQIVEVPYAADYFFYRGDLKE